MYKPSLFLIRHLECSNREKKLLKRLDYNEMKIFRLLPITCSYTSIFSSPFSELLFKEILEILKDIERNWTKTNFKNLWRFTVREKYETQLAWWHDDVTVVNIAFLYFQTIVSNSAGNLTENFWREKIETTGIFPQRSGNSLMHFLNKFPPISTQNGGQKMFTDRMVF